MWFVGLMQDAAIRIVEKADRHETARNGSAGECRSGCCGASAICHRTINRGDHAEIRAASNLTSLDPIWTTVSVTANHAYAVYDTLYAVNAKLEPKPQMAEGHTVSDDARTYLIKLREGLTFHDREPVRAQDCAASLARWAARDTMGQTLAMFVE